MKADEDQAQILSRMRNQEPPLRRQLSNNSSSYHDESESSFVGTMRTMMEDLSESTDRSIEVEGVEMNLLAGASTSPSLHDIDEEEELHIREAASPPNQGRHLYGNQKHEYAPLGGMDDLSFLPSGFTSMTTRTTTWPSSNNNNQQTKQKALMAFFALSWLLLLCNWMGFGFQWGSQPPQLNQMANDFLAAAMTTDSFEFDDIGFSSSVVDHWCLFGSDHACQCRDNFKMPSPAYKRPGWSEQHQDNKQALKSTTTNYDVVFVGDNFVEAMNGTQHHRQMKGGEEIKQDWVKHSSVQSAALGIAGDSSENLLWRLRHGEMPSTQYHAKLWWISIGINDLVDSGCSEEATVLGILRVAQEISSFNPKSVVVIQGLLPRSTRGQKGSLLPNREYRASWLGKKHSEAHHADLARKQYQSWPSIQRINRKLQDFCEKHQHLVYFGAANRLLGTRGKKRNKEHYIHSDLMTSDFVNLSVKGYKLLHQLMFNEVENIIVRDNEGNVVFDDYGHHD